VETWTIHPLVPTSRVCAPDGDGKGGRTYNLPARRKHPLYGLPAGSTWRRRGATTQMHTPVFRRYLQELGPSGGGRGWEKQRDRGNAIDQCPPTPKDAHILPAVRRAYAAGLPPTGRYNAISLLLHLAVIHTDRLLLHAYYSHCIHTCTCYRQVRDVSGYRVASVAAPPSGKMAVFVTQASSTDRRAGPESPSCHQLSTCLRPLVCTHLDRRPDTVIQAHTRARLLRRRDYSVCLYVLLDGPPCDLGRFGS
jgi:hypothetical protein